VPSYGGAGREGDGGGTANELGCRVLQGPRLRNADVVDAHRGQRVRTEHEASNTEAYTRVWQCGSVLAMIMARSAPRA
jgi:hypothetical protein